MPGCVLVRYYLTITLAFVSINSHNALVSSFNTGTRNNATDLTEYNVTTMDEIQRRILGGKFLNKISKHPYMALLVRLIILNAAQYQFREGLCGSTVLSSKFALTAAHCISDCGCDQSVDNDLCPTCKKVDPKYYTLFVGSNVPNAKSKFKIKKFHIHPEFKHSDDKHHCLGRFDIAVMELTTRIEFSHKVFSVTLPPPATLKTGLLPVWNISQYKKNCVILGWGMSKEINTDLTKRKLKVAKVNLFKNIDCENTLTGNKSKEKDRTFCLDTGFCTNYIDYNTAICNGDSGGPVICGGVQLGVASMNVIGCKGPSLFTRVDICVDWINKVISGNKKDFSFL